MPDLPKNLPPETVEVYQAYLGRPVLTRELLLAKVRAYIQTISSAAKETQGLDIGTASQLGSALMRLLRDCEDETLGHVQAAVLYFMESDDAEPDLSSTSGFDDDAEVFNAVCEHLGHSEHALEL